MNHLKYSKLEKALPAHTYAAKIPAEELRRHPFKWIVLDDDPTGTQTVHGVPVYTGWSVPLLCEALKAPGNLFFLLTNSRGLTETETAALHREITQNVSAASRETGVKYLYISRSDSTLRGHFPLETDLLAEGLREDYGHTDGVILYPFFPEGGRYTVGNIHYVRYRDDLVPASETEFAKDVTFGYKSSDLREYAEEKTGGKVKAEDVLCVSLEDLRNGPSGKITALLESAENGQIIVVNSFDYDDVSVFTEALYHALDKGKIFVFRTAAGFVKKAGGISDRGLLTPEDFPAEKETGGIVAIGSHTAKTTEQVKELLTLENVVPVEFRSSRVLAGDEEFEKEIRRCISCAEELIREGKTAAVFTERKYLALPDDTKESALLRSVKISGGLSRIVRDLSVKPSFVISKGGITSADVAVKSLRIRKATVKGQIRPGIPVWECEESATYGTIPFVIFPGNVGDKYDLKKAVCVLTHTPYKTEGDL
ncbi:MAG: hypothetical protein II783_02355 [Erysipelotrichales bacterium]|nr:hypothetical protein [Erysipelotrichales bacterium]